MVRNPDIEKFMKEADEQDSYEEVQRMMNVQGLFREDISLADLSKVRVTEDISIPDMFKDGKTRLRSVKKYEAKNENIG